MEEQHTGVRPLVGEKEAREQDEIAVIARDHDSLIGGRLVQLFLIGQPVAATLVRTHDVEPLGAADNRDLIGEVFIQVKTHQRAGGLVNGYVAQTRSGVQEALSASAASISSG